MLSKNKTSRWTNGTIPGHIPRERQSERRRFRWEWAKGDSGLDLIILWLNHRKVTPTARVVRDSHLDLAAPGHEEIGLVLVRLLSSYLGTFVDSTARNMPIQ